MPHKENDATKPRPQTLTNELFGTKPDSTTSDVRHTSQHFIDTQTREIRQNRVSCLPIRTLQEGLYLSKQGQNTRVMGWGREGKGDQDKNVSQLSEQGPTTEKVE